MNKVLLIRVFRCTNLLDTKATAKELVLIGRDKGCDLRIASPTASRFHAKVSLGPTGYSVQDLSSRNGTVLNRLPLNGGSAPLHDGDVLRLGDCELHVEIHDEEPTDRWSDCTALERRSVERTIPIRTNASE